MIIWFVNIATKKQLALAHNFVTASFKKRASQC